MNQACRLVTAAIDCLSCVSHRVGSCEHLTAYRRATNWAGLDQLTQLTRRVLRYCIPQTAQLQKVSALTQLRSLTIEDQEDNYEEQEDVQDDVCIRNLTCLTRLSRLDLGGFADQIAYVDEVFPREILSLFYRPHHIYG